MDSAEILGANKHGENLNKHVLCGEKLLAVFTYSSAALTPLLSQQIFSCLNAPKPQRNVRLSAFCMGAFGRKKVQASTITFSQLEEQRRLMAKAAGDAVHTFAH